MFWVHYDGESGEDEEGEIEGVAFDCGGGYFVFGDWDVDCDKVGDDLIFIEVKGN